MKEREKEIERERKRQPGPWCKWHEDTNALDDWKEQTVAVAAITVNSPFGSTRIWLLVLYWKILLLLSLSLSLSLSLFSLSLSSLSLLLSLSFVSALHLKPSLPSSILWCRAKTCKALCSCRKFLKGMKIDFEAKQRTLSLHQQKYFV